MANNKRHLADVGQLAADLSLSPTTRLGLQIIVGKDGKQTTEVVLGADAVSKVYSGLASQETIKKALDQYHGKASVHMPNGTIRVISSNNYGGRVVEQQRPHA